jgi:hypothetical protein
MGGATEGQNVWYRGTLYVLRISGRVTLEMSLEINMIISYLQI